MRWFGHLQRREGEYIGREDAQYGATRQETKRWTKAESHACGERGRCRGQGEIEVIQKTWVKLKKEEEEQMRYYRHSIGWSLSQMMTDEAV